MSIKRNNPGNIRKSAAYAWQGEIPGTQPGGYVNFDTLVNGYRAQIKLLNNYIVKGTDSIKKIINKWAPPSDNNPTDDYIKFVSNKTGIDSNLKLAANDFTTLSKIALAMSFFEHGIRDADQTMTEAITKAKGILEGITDTAKENPLTAAAIVATLYYLIIK